MGIGVDLKAFAVLLKRAKFSGAFVAHGFEEKDANAAGVYLKKMLN